MRLFYLAAFAVLLPTCALRAQIGNLLWQDEFNSLDASVWNATDGDGCPALCGFGNQELQSYEPENLTIEPIPGEAGNSALVFEARRENSGSRGFTSGKVDSKDNLSVQYGMIEVRMRVPDLNTGLWPAAWLLGTANITWPGRGEIDIMEMGHSTTEKARQGFPGANSNNYVGANAIFPADDGSAASIAFDTDYNTPYVSDESMADRFMTYRVYWEPTQMRFTAIDRGTEYDLYTDPLPLAEDNGTRVFKKPFYLLLNLAVGGNFTDAATNDQVTAPLPAKMYVDYVRVYEYNGFGSVETDYGVLDTETGPFGVFTDETPVNDELTFGADAEIYVWGETLEESDEAAVEGDNVISWRTTTDAWFGGGIASLFGRNMSEYLEEGVLRFRMKAPNNLGFRIGITDNFTNETWINFPAGVNQFGLERGNEWSQVEIPLSEYEGLLAFQNLNYLFAISSIGGAEPGLGTTFAIDDIYWDNGTGFTGDDGDGGGDDGGGDDGGGDDGGDDEAFSVRIEAEDYDAMNGVLIEPTTDVDGVENVGFIDPSDWMEYNVDIPSAGTYTFSFRVASEPGGAMVTLSSDGNDLGDFEVGPTGGWQSWTDVTLAVDLPAGSQTIRLTSQAASYNINWLSITGGGTATGGGGDDPDVSFSTRIEAEAYDAAEGVQLETTTDVDGVQNVGFIDPNDWMEYNVNLPADGTYRFVFRVASEPGGASVVLTSNGDEFGAFTVDPTGGWQSWTDVTLLAELPAGEQTIRLTSLAANYNLNWLSIELEEVGSTVSTNRPMGAATPPGARLSVFPVPVSDRLEVRVAGVSEATVDLRLLDAVGRVVIARAGVPTSTAALQVSNVAAGIYLLEVRGDKRRLLGIRRVVVQ